MIDKDVLFSPDGLLARRFQDDRISRAEGAKEYEYRPQQTAMFDGVCKAIDEKGHLVVEAGTGIGKTFAYLIPAIYYSLTNKKPVIISTNTINLQEQIVYKDIVFLQSVLPEKFTAILAKGRSNYICYRRLNKANQYQGDLFEHSSEIEELRRIKQRADSPGSVKAKPGRAYFDGSLSSLDWVPSNNVWNNICAESDNCAGKKCAYYPICFYQKARAQLWLANIIVVNHPLLLIDAAMRYEDEVNLLPKYDMLIVDEAHSLESVAQKHLGIEISNYQINHLLNSLWNPKKKKGVLQFVPHRLKKAAECKILVEESKLIADAFFDDVLAWFNNKAPENGRIKEKNIVDNLLSPVLAQLYFSLKELKADLGKKEKKKPPVDGGKPMAKGGYDDIELDAFIKRTIGLSEMTEEFIQQKFDDDYVYWMEVKKRNRLQPGIILQNAPLKVNHMLKELLLKDLQTAIFTSATLSTTAGKNGDASEGKEENLQYIKDALGIEKSADMVLDSPFNYAGQVKIYVTSNTPDPNDKDNFEPAASEKIMKYLEISNGRAFVLFTSYDLMHRVYDRVYPQLLEKGIPLYMQGRDLPRHQMLEEFRSRIGSVIFGAASFWQGVDVPGEALENIIITKLPFPVPTEPLVEARMEDMERSGIDSFKNYFMPEAILKLRQGVGRLIRTKTDKGIIVILDNRVLTKNYGKLFIQALPQCPLIIE
jgi:ATP-dependent DNA helicase DinG